MDQPDKLTQTRGSLEVKSSFIQKIYRCFCPCIVSTSSNNRNSQVYFDSQVSNRTDSIKSKTKHLQMPKTTNIPYNMSFTTGYDNQNQYKMSQFSTPSQSKKIKSKSFLINTTVQRKNKYLVGDQKNMQSTKKKQWYNYPIYKFSENQLIIIGKGNRHLLVEISTVYLQPSPCAVKKQYASKPNQSSQNYYNKHLDDFWNRRYFCFQKFDQGIQIDEESMSTVPPEIVSDYIAGKCDQCKTVLDAFSGIGSNALKLGSVCQKVICVQQDCKKSKYLINNAKVYEVQIEKIFLKPFVQIELNSSIDVVFAKPYLKNLQVLESSLCCIQQFEPSLDKVINKCFEISQNLILLLPANINIQRVVEIISQACHNLNKVFSTCSIKVQKVCFKSALSYLAIFFGPKVQKSIKLNDQLGFMYKVLKNKYEKNFQHKKFLKKLRQTYGMIKLLNFIYQSKKYEGKTQIDRFYSFVRQKKLLTQAKIQKIIEQQNKQKQRKNSRAISRTNLQIIDQTTVRSSVNEVRPSELSSSNNKTSNELEQNQQQKTQSERTQSFISNYSGFSNMKKYNTQSFAQSNKKYSERDRMSNNSSSILIKRADDSLQKDRIVQTTGGLKNIRFQDSFIQKQSKSPASPNIIPRNSIPIRGSLNLDIKKIEKEMNSTNKQQLKKSLITKIQEQI